jgi:nitrate reductase delta subunit
MKDANTYFKLLSLLLHYPDQDYVRALPGLESAVAQMPPSRQKTGIEAFLAEIKTYSVLHLQERYTTAFDLTPPTTLNMTYHIWGDGEKRAGAMTHLQNIYAEAGYEKTSAELPDYLPLMLEFMSLFPEVQASEPMRQCFEGLGQVVDRLRKIVPPYAALLQPLADSFGDSSAGRTQ